jgi:hypothetical protein
MASYGMPGHAGGGVLVSGNGGGGNRIGCSGFSSTRVCDLSCKTSLRRYYLYDRLLYINLFCLFVLPYVQAFPEPPSALATP